MPHIELEKGKSKETVNKNVNRLLEKGHGEEAAIAIAQRKARKSDNIKKLVAGCDALAERMDALERKKNES